MDRIGKTYEACNFFHYMCDNEKVVRTSYGEMYQLVSGMEQKLISVGFHRGERAALIAPVSPETILTGFSLAYAGITSVLLDASLPVEELEKLIAFSDVRAVFTTEELYHSLKGTFSDRLDFFALIHNEELKNYESAYSIDSLKAAPTIDPEEDVMAIIFSSGTTGTMKGIKVTYKSIMKSPVLFSRFVNITKPKKILYVFPFNHIAGFVICFVFTFWGWELGLIEKMNASKLQKALLDFNPHLFAIVPKVFEVMEQKIRAKVHEKGKVVEAGINGLLSLCYFLRKNLGINLGWYLFGGIRAQVFGKEIEQVGGGGTMFKESNAKFFYSLGLHWSDVYASTETGVPITATGIQDRIVAGTVGNVFRHPEIEIAIGNPDENGHGEILVKSELMMKGYFRQPELTREAFDENGYFKTGDSGYIDQRGYLHVIGRIKESIVLQSGKKVSPVDVDIYYSEKYPQYEVASRGIPSEDKQYDTIHLFIKNENYDLDEKEKIRSMFEEVSRSAPSMYQLSGIHFVEKIEKTSIGKTKRFLLEIEESNSVAEQKSTKSFTEEEKFLEVLRSYSSVQDISMEQSLTEDLGIDSLNMYQIIAELESIFHKDTLSSVQSIHTVGELFEAIKGDNVAPEAEEFDVSKFPMEKSAKDIKKLALIMGLIQKLWKFEVTGLEHFEDNKQYIICPNHESHFDGLFVFATLYKAGKIQLDKICCMAKKEHLDYRITRNWLKMLGGIPVDRFGMSAPSIQRSIQCINEGYAFLIHPEGTRTRDGKLGVFRPGAAKLAEETGKEIIPVRIDGAYELYPHDKKLPKLFDWKHMRRYRIQISFGKPIAKEDVSDNECMDKVKASIIEMGSEE